MTIQPKAIYGIIGNPLTHSLSPLMHNAVFKALSVNAVYKTFPLKEEQVEAFINDLREKDNPVFGLNVTVPYKEKVLKYMDSLHPFAEKVGAVNTIVISADRKLRGFNTDGPGFLTHLTELNFDARKKRVAVLGAGGSARAIIATLCMIPERPESILIYSRTQAKADQLIDDLSRRLDTMIVKSVASTDDLNIELTDLLINATPLGLNDDDDSLIPVGALHANMLVYDLIYNPPETRLLTLAKEQGAKISNGLGMLFYQGVLSFQHWADIQLNRETKKIMRQALEEGIK